MQFRTFGAGFSIFHPSRPQTWEAGWQWGSLRPGSVEHTFRGNLGNSAGQGLRGKPGQPRAQLTDDGRRRRAGVSSPGGLRVTADSSAGGKPGWDPGGEGGSTGSSWDPSEPPESLSSGQRPRVPHAQPQWVEPASLLKCSKCKAETNEKDFSPHRAESLKELQSLFFSFKK